MTKKISTQSFVSIKLIDFSENDKEKFKSILDLAELRLDIPWKIVTLEEADFYLIDSQSKLKDEKNTLLQTISPKQFVVYTQSTVGNNENELVVSDANIPSIGSLVKLFNYLITIEIDSNVSDVSKSIEAQPVDNNHVNKFSFENLLIDLESTPTDIIEKPVVSPSSKPITLKNESVLNEELDINLNDDSFSISKPEKKQKKDDPKKNRKAVRYAFDPIEANLEKKSFPGFNKNLTIQIINISSSGVLIELNQSSKLRGQVTLNIQLDPLHTFIISARVVRNEGKTLYGLHFLKSQHELLNYLVSSKLSFIFS